MGPLTRTAVHDILRDQIRRSGLELPEVGGHALRHSLAAHLLRRGVALESIGAVLGHRSAESTAVYLRLAVEDLREVGLPVPRDGKIVPLEQRRQRVKLPRVRLQVSKPLAGASFHSGLSASLRRYLDTRRAMGRDYTNEEAVLRRWIIFWSISLVKHAGFARR